MTSTEDIILKIIAATAGAVALAICSTLEQRSQEEGVPMICHLTDSDT